MKNKNKQRLTTIEAYQLVFSSREGRRVLADLLKLCHMERDTFVAGDPHQTSWRCGQRSVGLRIYEILKLDTKKIAALMKEQEMIQNDDTESFGG